MPRNDTPVNIYIPHEWKEQLKRLALQKSLEEDRKIGYLETIRMAIAAYLGISATKNEEEE